MAVEQVAQPVDVAGLFAMPAPHFATDFHVDASVDGADWKTVGTVHGAN